jgi:hypothetical protein
MCTRLTHLRSGSTTQEDRFGIPFAIYCRPSCLSVLPPGPGDWVLLGSAWVDAVQVELESTGKGGSYRSVIAAKQRTCDETLTKGGFASTRRSMEKVPTDQHHPKVSSESGFTLDDGECLMYQLRAVTRELKTQPLKCTISSLAQRRIP